MRFTPEEELDEILRRSKKIMLRRERRKVQFQAFLTGACAVLLMFLLAFMPKGSMMTSKNSVYGSFLLAKESGGYVLIALIAFVLGIMVTFICVKYRKLRELGEKEEKTINLEEKIEEKRYEENI